MSNETPGTFALTLDRDGPLANFQLPGDLANRRAMAVLTASASVPANYDNGKLIQVNSTTERYEFYLGTTLLRSVTLVYTNASKQDLSTWVIA